MDCRLQIADCRLVPRSKSLLSKDPRQSAIFNLQFFSLILCPSVLESDVFVQRQFAEAAVF
jgi:hypothetical protein